jgi:hypothetical protein
LYDAFNSSTEATAPDASAMHFHPDLVAAKVVRWVHVNLICLQQLLHPHL